MGHHRQKEEVIQANQRSPYAASNGHEVLGKEGPNTREETAEVAGQH
jgi:hypothetical protein